MSRPCVQIVRVRPYKNRFGGDVISSFTRAGQILRCANEVARVLDSDLEEPSCIFSLDTRLLIC